MIKNFGKMFWIVGLLFSSQAWGTTLSCLDAIKGIDPELDDLLYEYSQKLPDGEGTIDCGFFTFQDGGARSCPINAGISNYPIFRASAAIVDASTDAAKETAILQKLATINPEWEKTFLLIFKRHIVLSDTKANLRNMIDGYCNPYLAPTTAPVKALESHSATFWDKR